MATPRITHPAKRPTGPCASASVTSPAAKITLLAASTGLPPCWSMALPAAGPSNADTTSAAEKAANTVGC
jgi:hypothetical protein